MNNIFDIDSAPAMKLIPEIRVGITHGDINGIGYEVILKALQDPEILDVFVPVLYGSSKIASYHRKSINTPDLPFNHIRKGNQALPNKVNIVNVIDKEVRVEIGKSTQIGGELAALALEMAVADLEAGNIDVLVTAPINKKNIQSESFSFPGHTEYLAEKFGAKDSLMLMVAGKLRIGTVTGHLPLKDVSKSITSEKLVSKLNILYDSLRMDFGIRKPKIAVLSLNPHSGDEGLLGNEEIQVINPVIERLNRQGMMIYGPFSSDGFFGSGNYVHFDAILAMYHDQGLTTFKILSHGEGVNFTAGLPIVRTSPAHGTAYEIAGQDKASATSMISALFMSLQIYRNRIEYKYLTNNTLKRSEPLPGDGE